VGQILVNQPVMRAGSGAVILTDGGGHGTLAADALTELGVELATLLPSTIERLHALLGRAANGCNPVDVAGAADRDPRILARALEILAPDPNVGGVLLVGLFGGYSHRFSGELAPAEDEAAHEMARIMAEANKPLVMHSLYASTPNETLGWLRQHGVPVTSSIEIGARCMRAAYSRGRFLESRPLPAPPPPPRRTEPPAITLARRDGRSTLMEPEARALLCEQGVALVPATLARTADAVARAVRQAGEPVGLKIVSPAISHKSEAGGVALEIQGEDEARQAFRRVLDSAAQYAVSGGTVPDIRGVLVTPMLSQPVAEIIVGVKRDAQFGPVLTVGAGGIAVELFRDTAHRRLPVSRAEVLEMLEEIRLAPLLKGYRGRAAADLEALTYVILGVAACALSHPEIEELEANPVFAYPDSAVVVDVRAFLRDLPDSDRTSQSAADTATQATA
jgi:acetyltransferase